MMTTKSCAVALGSTLALAFGFQMPASAEDLSFSPMPIEGQGAPPTVVTLTGETLKSTIIQYQSTSTGIALKAGFNTAFSTTASCPGTLTKCTFVFQDMIQVGFSKAANNRWAICGRVDSTLIFPVCPFQGIVPTGAAIIGSSLQNFRVTSHGPHTLKVLIFVDFAGASWANAQAEYLTYTP